jgi:hypothetical protein
MFDWRLTSGCADPRDRIYGLLALASDYPGFDVNYTEDVADLFWRAGEHFDVWAMPDRICSLLDALRLDFPTLADHAPIGISLRVAQDFPVPRTAQSRSDTITDCNCPNERGEAFVSIPIKHPRVIHFCTGRKTSSRKPGCNAPWLRAYPAGS